jgi:hypothetical protein
LGFFECWKDSCWNLKNKNKEEIHFQKNKIKEEYTIKNKQKQTHSAQINNCTYSLGDDESVFLVCFIFI